MNPVIAIDPGSSSGALALRYGEGRIALYNMPETPGDLYDFLEIADPELCVMENVGGTMPGNSARSARTFATHIGHLEMAMAALRIPLEKVTPAKWMDVVAPGRSKTDKARRKTDVYAALKMLYPHVKFTKKQADALGILHWWMKKSGIVIDATGSVG